MNNLEDLQAELARQNTALEAANTALTEMGDVRFQIPEEQLAQLDDACAVQTSVIPYNPGLRARRRREEVMTSISNVNNSVFAGSIDAGGNDLTPDALMSYCSTRLRGLDEQIQAGFAKQKLANAISSDLSALQAKLNTLIGGASSLKVVHGGAAENDATIKDMAQALLDAANTAKDPAVAKALTEKARALVVVTGDPPKATFNRAQDVNLPAKEYSSADLKAMTSDAVGEIQKDINAGTELSMINLQSLMSQRQSSVQMVTNMVQALGDQMNKITSNIGH